MIYFVYEKNMEDRELINSLRKTFGNLEVVSANVTIGGWNSLFEKINNFWKKYFFLSVKALRKSKNGDTILTWQVFLGIVTGLLIRIFKIKRELIILSFIYKQRSNKIIRKLRYLVTKYGLSSAQKIICYSEYEKGLYTELFKLKKSKFYFIELGKTFVIPTYTEEEFKRYIFSAGQSNRDYDVLLRSIYNIEIELLIATTNNICVPENISYRVKIKRLYGNDFQKALKQSLLVVIPLRELDFSSGQIILINSMAAGKCTILTETKWSKNYVKHGINAWLVKKGDEQELATAIKTLIDNDKLRREIELNSRRTYEEKLNGNAFAERISRIIME